MTEPDPPVFRERIESDQPATLVIRADGNTRIGAGHVMRSLAVAQAWQDRGGQVAWAAASLSTALEARLKEEQVAVHKFKTTPGTAEDARQLVALARDLQAPWMLLDGYVFDSAYQALTANPDVRRILIDDLVTPGPWSCEVLVNQAINVTEHAYAEAYGVETFLLGPQYFLLRREFRSMRGGQRQAPPVAHEIFVSFGGADQHNLTGRTLQAITALDRPLRVTVVASSQHAVREHIEDLAANAPHDVRLVWDARNMAAIMAQADLAVIAGGTTSWEAAFMGLPSLVVTLAANQAPHVRAFEAQGACHALGGHGDLTASRLAQEISALIADPDRRQRYANAGQALVDGFGPERVVNACLLVA